MNVARPPSAVVTGGSAGIGCAAPANGFVTGQILYVCGGSSVKL